MSDLALALVLLVLVVGVTVDNKKSTVVFRLSQGKLGFIGIKSDRLIRLDQMALTIVIVFCECR